MTRLMKSLALWANLIAFSCAEINTVQHLRLLLPDVCSDAALRDVESNMTRLREAEDAASTAAEHKREEVRQARYISA